MNGYSWRCPFCEQNATITRQNISVSDHTTFAETADGPVGLRSVITICPNKACRKYTLDVHHCRLVRTAQGSMAVDTSDEIAHWQLVPFGASRAFPDYVPKPVRDDYEEACKIRDLSPKASATLARRAVQGVIRHFWEIRKPTLKQELDELKNRNDVPHEVWEAIDALREVGNIGAHMEKDIDLIIDIDPNEAAALIEFVELLIEDTYVARELRRSRLQKVKSVASEKASEKNLGSRES
jgi:hypothetical protein